MVSFFFYYKPPPPCGGIWCGPHPAGVRHVWPCEDRNQMIRRVSQTTGSRAPLGKPRFSITIKDDTHQQSSRTQRGWGIRPSGASWSCQPFYHHSSNVWTFKGGRRAQCRLGYQMGFTLTNYRYQLVRLSSFTPAHNPCRTCIPHSGWKALIRLGFNVQVRVGLDPFKT